MDTTRMRDLSRFSPKSKLMPVGISRNDAERDGGGRRV